MVPAPVRAAAIVVPGGIMVPGRMVRARMAPGQTVAVRMDTAATVVII